MLVRVCQLPTENHVGILHHELEVVGVEVLLERCEHPVHEGVRVVAVVVGCVVVGVTADEVDDCVCCFVCVLVFAHWFECSTGCGCCLDEDDAVVGVGLRAVDAFGVCRVVHWFVSFDV